MSTLTAAVEEALSHQVEMSTHELMKEPDWVLIMGLVERINMDRYVVDIIFVELLILYFIKLVDISMTTISTIFFIIL